MKEGEEGMFLLVVVFFSILIFLGIFGIIGPTRGAIHEQEQKVWHDKYLERKANEVVQNIQYIKDPRTGLCFARYPRTGILTGGPTLIMIPCDSIPPHLLTVGK